MNERTPKEQSQLQQATGELLQTASALPARHTKADPASIEILRTPFPSIGSSYLDKVVESSRRAVVDHFDGLIDNRTAHEVFRNAVLSLTSYRTGQRNSSVALGFSHLDGSDEKGNPMKIRKPPTQETN